MARILAIDYGKKRTGLAETDDLQIIASGLTTVDTSSLFDFIAKYLRENQVEKFVVGYPLRLNGEKSETTLMVESFSEKLLKKFPTIPIQMVDERLTSQMAFNVMIESGISKKKRRNKGLIDKISATIILQSYLEQNN
mgnify:CR=1 FL=1